jgi:hypothetical protein
VSREATIGYEKDDSEELWENTGSSWVGPINVYLRVGTKEAGYRGKLVTTLGPGMIYQICIARAAEGPLSARFVPQDFVTIFGLLTKPPETALVKEYTLDFGGTWSSHRIITQVPTTIVEIGVSRKPISLDGQGIPVLDPNLSDGSPTTPPLGLPPAPPTRTTNHVVEINPLLPGNDYFFTVLVMDPSGNWEVR